MILKRRCKGMALIKCKECGKEISDKAESCPNCGNVIKERTKKTGTIVILIASSIFVVFFLLLQIASLTPTQKNPEYSESGGIHIEVSIGENENIINKNIQTVMNIVFWFSPILLTLLSILRLTKDIPSKKIYGILSLILSLLWLFVIVIYLNKQGCCNIIFVLNPIIALIGSIITIVELLGERKNEIKTDNK